MRGCVHIYCGDGKGKTSAALGLAVRAAGRGRKVLLVRFLKTEDSGEVPILRELPGITVVPCEKSFGFTFQMDQKQKEGAARYYTKRLLDAWELAVQEQYQVLILDEIMASCTSGMVKEADLLSFLKEKPEFLEVVMTGRDPSQSLVDVADYVSEICMIKHPFAQGIPAREGIEY